MDIKILVMDVDGTLTDGKIYMGEDGEVCKAFNIKDGYGIHDVLIPKGIIPVVITGRQSRIVEKRCAELGIVEIYQGVKDKGDILKRILQKYKLKMSNVAYIGDDLNDMPCILQVKHAGGVVGCPLDAVKGVRDSSNFIATSAGGEGAVREMIEYILAL